MAPSAVRDTNQTSHTPSSADPWHVGTSPVFPSSLILSKDAAVQAMLTDIPFLSVGLLGFGVLTFFFAMRKFSRLSFCIFASVIVAFIAGVLDVGQVLIRGRDATDSNTNISSVLPLLVAREITLSISIGIRFLFFWIFVSQPPRGERRVRPRNDFQEERLNFLRLESDTYGGSWVRLGYILWRVVAGFSKIGPVYEADSALEIAISILIIIKLFMNAWLSPLTPRWKTIRDYSPVMVALLIGLGVSIGNTLQFQFSETSLGRFMQAVQLYILVLYVHIASFYGRRSVLDPMVQHRASKTSMPAEDVETRYHTSTIHINPTTTSAPPDVTGGFTLRTGKVYPLPSSRLSSWLVHDADRTPMIADAPRRLSTADRITAWIASRRGSKQDREQSPLRSDLNVESGTLVDTAKTGFVRLPEAKEFTRAATWKDSLYLSPAPVIPASQRLQRLTKALGAPIPGMRNGAVSPDGTISSFDAVEIYSRNDFTPPKSPKLPGSPVYGLDGIVRYHGQFSSPLSQPTPSSRRTSVQSASMKSLLRQQAELDKNVADLLVYPISGTSSEKLVVPGGQSLSLQSDFSLSHFPDPPPNLPSWSADKDVVDGSLPDQSDVDQLQQANVEAVPPPPVAAGPSQISQSTMPVERQSFASTSRGTSSDSAVLGIASRAVVGSVGTQYDVTSFIGHLTKPALKVSFSEAKRSRHPTSLVMGRPDAGDVPTAANTRPAADITPSVTVQTSQAPPSTISPTTKPSVPRRTKQGLPSGIKLNISSPFRQPSVDRPTAYERPRPVPPPMPPS